MKTTISTLSRLLFFSFILLFSLNKVQAQSNKKEAAKEKSAELSKLINSKRYVFKAQSVTPQRGNTRQLTSEYDVQVKGDSLVTYLPYFGRAYSAPINSSESGIKFTSTDYDYATRSTKKNGWEIIFKPNDAKDIRQLILNVFANGYAQLQVMSENRDAISFYGYLEEIKSRK